jgi:hypothetical protein
MLAAVLLLLQAAQEPAWRASLAKEGADAERVVAAEDGSLSLASDWSKWTKPADPSKWHVVTDLKVFQGRLIGSSCYDFDGSGMLSPWAYSDGNEFVEYLPASDEWKVIHSQKTSMVFNFREVAGKLYAPEFHAFTANRLYTFDGGEWKETFPLPKEMLHGMDVCEWKGKIYLAGSWRTKSGNEAQNDPNWYGGYAKLYESSDAGATWKEVYETRENGRVLSLTPWKDRLWANSRGVDLVSWDGAGKWAEHPIKLKGSSLTPPIGPGALLPMGERLCVVNAPLVYLFDGKAWDSATPGCVTCAKIGDTLYGVRDDGHVFTTTDGKKWTKATTEAIPKAEFDRQAPLGRPIKRGSVMVHRGRLVVGTGATGLVYMTPFHEKGSFSTAPAKASLPRSGTLEVDAVAPDGTKLVVQVRSAASREELAKASWKTPDEKGAVGFGKDHAWVQARVQMESDRERRRSPIVRAISLKP